MSKQDYVEVELPSAYVEVLELIGREVGKTGDELLLEAIREGLADHDKFMQEVLELAKEAKEAGLTTIEYIDRGMEQLLEHACMWIPRVAVLN